MALLNIVIGIVFVMLLFSLLGSTIMELLSGIMSLRGKQLAKALRNMLQDQTRDFFSHPYFQQLKNGSNAGPSTRFTRGVEPSYINPETFSSIVMDMLTRNQTGITNAVGSLKDGNLKEMLQFMIRKTGDDPAALSKQVELWFNDVMDRVGGSYKRTVQALNFLIGAAIAVIFNVDPITIYHSLSVNTAFSSTLAEAANSFAQSDGQGLMTQSASTLQAKEKVSSLVVNNISVLESPLGIGWSQVDWSQVDQTWWLYHIVGWLTTAISITLGSSFWFDLLKSIVNVRGAGAAPTSVFINSPAPAAAPPYYPSTPGSGYDTPAGSGSIYDVPAQPAAGNSRSNQTPSPPTDFLPPTNIPNEVNPFDDLSARFDNP